MREAQKNKRRTEAQRRCKIHARKKAAATQGVAMSKERHGGNDAVFTTSPNCSSSSSSASKPPHPSPYQHSVTFPSLLNKNKDGKYSFADSMTPSPIPPQSEERDVDADVQQTHKIPKASTIPSKQRRRNLRFSPRTPRVMNIWRRHSRGSRVTPTWQENTLLIA